jgi:putative methionine-R-sulfoxide reductase with GAF domain
MAGRQKYDQSIAKTMARHAFERREPQYWGNVEEQSDFRQNPEASAPTWSLVATPISKGEAAIGVFNAISAERDAFDEVEQKSMLALAGMIAVAVGVWQQGGWGGASAATTGVPASFGKSKSEKG